VRTGDSLSWNNEDREVSIGGLGRAKGIERDNYPPIFFGGHFRKH
jgi:hypothetical protein